MSNEPTHREIAFIFTYSGKAESWEEIKDDAENNKVKSVFIGTKEFVNVIRCKDCKFYYDNGGDEYTCVTEPDWFCGDGKRKGEE